MVAKLELGTTSFPILVHSSAEDHRAVLAYHHLTGCNHKHTGSYYNTNSQKWWFCASWVV